MKTLIKRVENFNSAETEWGVRIRENVRHRFLEISSPNFEIVLSLSSLRITLRVQRPDHEHDDFYTLELTLPDKGLVEYGQKGRLELPAILVYRFLDLVLRKSDYREEIIDLSDLL